MEDYAGFEPQVGEIRALRTFRIGPDSGLYPLYSDTAWIEGKNTASCNVLSAVSGDHFETARHAAPDPACTCGYYAYASESAAAERPHAQHVLAVVACWGKVIAGTRGIRAEHARVEALWMSATVPGDLASSVAARYPTTTVYSDQAAMLAEHPPTVLECYEPDEPGPSRKSLAMRLAIVAALVIGSLPAGWIWQQQYLRLIWAAEVCLFVAAAVILRRTRRDIRAPATTLLYLGLTVWLVAPFAGSAGLVLLRLPLVQITTLGLLQRTHLNREARRFPARIARRQQ
jgi:hypothetical protein